MISPAVRKRWMSEVEKVLATMPRLASTPPSITVTRQPKCLIKMLHRGPAGRKGSNG